MYFPALKVHEGHEHKNRNSMLKKHSTSVLDLYFHCKLHEAQTLQQKFKIEHIQTHTEGIFGTHVFCHKVHSRRTVQQKIKILINCIDNIFPSVKFMHDKLS